MKASTGSFTRAERHSCERQQRAGAITAETQTRWRLLRNPKDGATLKYLYVHMCADLFFFIYMYVHIYYLQHFYVVFLSGKRSYTPGVSQNPKVNVSFTVGRREVDTKRLRVLGMHTTYSSPDELPGGVPSPVIDSLVPLGSNTGICWPRDHHLLSCSQQSLYFIPAKKRGKEKKKHKSKLQHFFLWVPLPEVFRGGIWQTWDLNARTSLRGGFMMDGAMKD